MGYSTDFKEKVLKIMIRDKMSVRKAALYFGVCAFDSAMKKVHGG